MAALTIASRATAQRPDGDTLVLGRRYHDLGTARITPGWRLPSPDTLQQRQAVPAFCCKQKHFPVAAAELAALEIIPWYFNRHVGDDSTAVLTFNSWKRNIEQGFEWDPNSFDTNMFMHPYHGNVYFNAARTNGYSFWESAAFTWFGSFIWEFFGENNRPAVNDWVNTSLGGIVIGEAFNRASRAILNNRARGAGRTVRELAAFSVNPIGGANRIFRGEASRVGPNPPLEERLPERTATATRGGLRWVGDADQTNGLTGFFYELNFSYGNPFIVHQRPFDAFQISMQLNTNDRRILGRLQVEGTLFDVLLKATRTSHHVFGITQHYDYVDTHGYRVGGQSVSASFLSYYRLSENLAFVTKIQPTAAVISGISSVYAQDTGRDYDFGSGAGLRTWAGLLTGSGDDLVSFFYILVWSHSLNGAAGDHYLQFLSLKAQLPPRGWRPGVGGEFTLAARNSVYRDFPDVSRHNPEIRLFFSIF